MKAHWNIEQRTQEWHRVKWGYIGSSDASKVLKYKPFDDVAFDLATQREEEAPEYFEEGYINNDMQRGIDLEPFAVECVEKKYNIKFNTCGFIHSETLPIGVSPDAITLDCEMAVETKCLSGREHKKVCYYGELPYKYTPQAIMYFAAIKPLKTLYWCAYRPEAATKAFDLVITPETLVNIGTEAKAVMVTMKQAAELIRSNAGLILKDVETIKIIQS